MATQVSDQLHGRDTGLHTLHPGFSSVLHFSGEHFRPVATLCQRVHGLGRYVAAVQRGQHHAGVVIPAARRGHVGMRQVERLVFWQRQGLFPPFHLNPLFTYPGHLKTVFCLQAVLTIPRHGQQFFAGGHAEGFTAEETPVSADIPDFHPCQHAVTVD